MAGANPSWYFLKSTFMPLTPGGEFNLCHALYSYAYFSLLQISLQLWNRNFFKVKDAGSKSRVSFPFIKYFSKMFHFPSAARCYYRDRKIFCQFTGNINGKTLFGSVVVHAGQ